MTTRKNAIARAKKRRDLSQYRYKHLAAALIDRFGAIHPAAVFMGYSDSAFYEMLKGRVNPRKDMIDIIKDTLGMTYEDMFIEDKEKEK